MSFAQPGCAHGLLGLRGMFFLLIYRCENTGEARGGIDHAALSDVMPPPVLLKAYAL
jgi:hypothetical protein